MPMVKARICSAWVCSNLWASELPVSTHALTVIVVVNHPTPLKTTFEFTQERNLSAVLWRGAQCDLSRRASSIHTCATSTTSIPTCFPKARRVTYCQTKLQRAERPTTIMDLLVTQVGCRGEWICLCNKHSSSWVTTHRHSLLLSRRWGV